MAKAKKTANTATSARLRLGNMLLADLVSHYEGRYQGPHKSSLDTLERDRPKEYFELLTKHIPPAADAETKPDLSKADSMLDLGRKLLQSTGLKHPTDEQAARAMDLNNQFIRDLEAIRDSDISRDGASLN